MEAKYHIKPAVLRIDTQNRIMFNNTIRSRPEKNKILKKISIRQSHTDYKNYPEQILSKDFILQKLHDVIERCEPDLKNQSTIVKCIELLGKEIKMFTDRQEIDLKQSIFYK